MTDADYLIAAAKLAVKGLGHTRPNPAVGAIIVKNGKIIGKGWHKKAGGDHAEVAAIKNALKRTRRSASLPSGCVLYVTLEPCSKPGRVGACTDAIIAAGIKKVVYAVPDPNPKNRGKAKRVLARTGVSCDLFKGDESVTSSCRWLVSDFRKHVLTGLPYVSVKIAMSLDGKICDDWGSSNWISCPLSLMRTNEIRSRVDAIMVGAETVRKDNPSLLSRVRRNDDLIRVVVTRSGKLPKNAQIFTDGAPNETWVFRVGKDAKDLKDVLRQLGKMGVMHVHCEGGLKLARSLADAGLVDEWITVLAPVVIGSRRLRQAIRGTTFREQSFLSGCDSFLSAGLSEHAVWTGKVD